MIDKEILIENGGENLDPDTDTSSGVHMGRNLKRLRTAEKVKQLTIADALGHKGKGAQQFISRLEEQAVISDDILAIVAPLINCTVNHIKYMKEGDIPKNMYKFYDNSSYSSNAQNITFNPLDALKEQFEKTQNVYERWLEEQKELIQSTLQTINSTNQVLLTLAEKLKS